MRILGNPAATALTVLARGEVVGNLGAWTDDELHERLVCYWIRRESWGRGIASAAVRAFLEVETTRPLIARVARHNLGSIRVLEKVGFKRVGEDAFTLPDGTRFEEYSYALAS